MADIRQRLSDAIQAARGETDEDLNGAMLMGFVVIAEWMTPSSGRWLSVVAGDANAETLPDWTCQGYLHNVLHDWAPAVLDRDDEDDDE